MAIVKVGLLLVALSEILLWVRERLSMALHDWNHDGKKDWQDNFIEYQIYKDATGQKKNSSYTSSNGISTFGAILSTVGGLFLGAMIVALFAGDKVG